MRTAIRTLVASAIFGLVLAAGSGIRVHGKALADTPRVILYDNDGSFQGIDPALSEWGYMPDRIVVTRGAQVVFDNPASNLRPHTVTSITWAGTAPTRTLMSGAAFDSSPTRDQYIMPGTTWTLDTLSLDPGRYDFYCTVHPWMLGTLTVLAPAS